MKFPCSSRYSPSLFISLLSLSRRLSRLFSSNWSFFLHHYKLDLFVCVFSRFISLNTLLFLDLRPLASSAASRKLKKITLLSRKSLAQLTSCMPKDQEVCGSNLPPTPVLKSVSWCYLSYSLIYCSFLAIGSCVFCIWVKRTKE